MSTIKYPLLNRSTYMCNVPVIKYRYSILLLNPTAYVYAQAYIAYIPRYNKEE